MSAYEDSNEVIGDIISRLIEGDMTSGKYKGNQWRPAATLDIVAQALVAQTHSEDETIAAFAADLLGDVLLSMTYLELGDDEQEAYDRQWAEIVNRLDHPKKDDDDRSDEE